MTDEELEQMAILTIYNYYNSFYTEDYIKENFNLAIKVLLSNAKDIKINGVSSISENGTSITYKNDYGKFSITSDVLALLPKKKSFYAW